MKTSNFQPIIKELGSRVLGLEKKIYHKLE
jgi:hypothetical protein